MQLLKVTAIGQEARFRGGQHFTRIARRIDPAQLSEEQRAAIEADPILRVEEVEGELDDSDAADGKIPPMTADETEAMIRQVITELPVDAYSAKGLPKMAPFRDVLSALPRGKEISADQKRVLESFERMKKDDGFEPPST